MFLFLTLKEETQRHCSWNTHSSVSLRRAGTGGLSSNG